jgi:RND family efflux transporter MFP subunit
MQRLRSVIVPTVVCAALTVVSGCKVPEVPPPPPPEVAVETPKRRDVTLFGHFTGNTSAVESVEVRARVQGFLERYTFEPGTLVRKGELLFLIEQAPFIASRDRAAAEVSSSEAAVRRAESDLDRLEQAIKKNAVSQQEVTRATAERDQAQAALLSTKANLEQAEIDLAYTEIKSPITGVVSRHLVDPGNLVGRTDATLLARVFNIDPIHVYFEINEQLIAKFLERRGGLKGSVDTPDPDPVEITLEGVDRVFEGYIDYIDPAADPDTGTLQTRAVVPNSEGRLLPGFFVRIRVPGTKLPDAILVPETALSTDLGGRYLLLVDDDGIVQKRYVEPGQLEDDNMRVVEGLEGSERFITQGLQRARPGMPVTIKGD